MENEKFVEMNNDTSLLNEVVKAAAKKIDSLPVDVAADNRLIWLQAVVQDYISRATTELANSYVPLDKLYWDFIRNNVQAGMTQEEFMALVINMWPDRIGIVAENGIFGVSYRYVLRDIVLNYSPEGRLLALTCPVPALMAQVGPANHEFCFKVL